MGLPLGMGRNRAAGGVRRVAASMVVGLPNRLLVTQDSTDPWRSRSFWSSCGHRRATT